MKMKIEVAKLMLVCAGLVVFALVFRGQSYAEIDPKSVLGIWLFDEGESDVTEDSSYRGNDGRIVGEPKWVEGKFGKALEFAGMDNYIRIADDQDVDDQNLDPGHRSFTISLWARPNSVAGAARLIWKNDGSTPPYRGYYLMLDKIFAGGFGDGTNISSPYQINSAREGNWHHVVLARNKSERKTSIYINGVKENEADDTTDNVYYGTDFCIGGRPGTSEFFNGTIDEVAIFNTALTEEEIKYIMNDGLSKTLSISKAKVGGKPKARVSKSRTQAQAVLRPAFRIEGSWATEVPPPPSDYQQKRYGYKPLDYQTTFFESRLGSHTQLNNQTAVGVPGWVPMGFNYLMRLLYSEFEVNFMVDTDKGERRPYLLENFSQSSPGGWLPGAVNEWDYEGIHYKVTYIVVPNEPQPVDLCQIVLKNTSNQEAQGHLFVTLDGAPTLRAEGDLISDRGKPLAIMDPVVPAAQIARESGCLDPRALAVAPWHPCMFPGEWTHWRAGWYGIPVEYLVRADGEKSQQVYLGLPFFHQNGIFCDAVQASVEGVGEARRIERSQDGSSTIARFIGKDTDEDGYIKISVSAVPGSPRKRSMLAVIRTFDVGTTISEEDIRTDKGKKKARHWIDVGGDFPGELTMLRVGTDPTVFALRLSYQPTLAPSEERSYLLKFPAIDRKEPSWCANLPRPYDTRESWKGWGSAPRDTDSISSQDQDVPAGFDPEKYGVFGPKPKPLWQQQLTAVKGMSWEEAIGTLQGFWDNFVDQGAMFLVPDKTVENLYKHQLAIMEIYRQQWYPHKYYMQLNGPDFYWEYCSRDGSYENVAWDMAGFPKQARSLLDTLLVPKSQLPPNRYTFGQWDDDSDEYDGAWQTRGNQWDAQGQTLWAITTHYLLTGDKEWLALHYDAIVRAAEWIIRRRAMEREKIGNPDHPAYGSMPIAGEEFPVGGGHSIYVNGFTYLGLQRCEMVARELGRRDDAVRFQREADDMKKALHRAIELCFVRFNDFSGTIPPTVEDAMRVLKGEVSGPIGFTTDFGGSLVWPTEAITPHNPLFNAFYRYREQEGSTTGGLMWWPYIYADQGIGYIRRGEPDRAADLFFCYIDSASGTNDWGEQMRFNAPFLEFDPPKVAMCGTGDSPHGEACANYINYFRNLMLHEEGETLHLAPAIPRHWLAQPKPVGVEGAPSFFGPVTYHLVADTDRSTIRGDVKLDPSRKPSRLLIHVRGLGGRGLQSVKLNNNVWENFVRDTIIVPYPPDKITIEAEYDH